VGYRLKVVFFLYFTDSYDFESVHVPPEFLRILHRRIGLFMFFCVCVEGLIFNKIKGNNTALPIVAPRNIPVRQRVMDKFPATVFGGVA
jgi:hypothetical protein